MMTNHWAVDALPAAPQDLTASELLAVLLFRGARLADMAGDVGRREQLCSMAEAIYERLERET